MLVVFSPVFVADTIVFVYDFNVPLNTLNLSLLCSLVVLNMGFKSKWNFWNAKIYGKCGPHGV